MGVWMSPEQVAKRLDISRRSALTLMNQMPHTVVSGNIRKRIRVLDTTLESWLLKRSTGKQTMPVSNTGSTRRLQRRRE